MAASSTLLSCANVTEERAKEAVYGPIIHSVFFWLKEDITEQEKLDFVNFFESLRPIPGIQMLTYGKPATTNQRDVVDSSFSYNLIVTFTTMDDINVYETHPIHLEAIEKYKKYWTKVTVYDTQV